MSSRTRDYIVLLYKYVIITMSSMSLASRFYKPSTLLRRVGTEIRYMPLRMYVLLTTSIAGVAVRDATDARGAFPEPADVFNHVGNVTQSVNVGTVVATGASLVYAARADSPNIWTARAVATGAATAAGLAINTLVETTTGQKAHSLGEHSRGVRPCLRSINRSGRQCSDKCKVDTRGHATAGLAEVDI
jgi:hypothetical protein